MNKKQQEMEQRANKMLEKCSNILEVYKSDSNAVTLSDLVESTRTFMTLSMLSSALKDKGMKISKKLKDNKPLDKLEKVYETMTKLGVCLMTNKGLLSDEVVNEILKQEVSA